MNIREARSGGVGASGDRNPARSGSPGRILHVPYGAMLSGEPAIRRVAQDPCAMLVNTEEARGHD